MFGNCITIYKKPKIINGSFIKTSKITLMFTYFQVQYIKINVITASLHNTHRIPIRKYNLNGDSN